MAKGTISTSGSSSNDVPPELSHVFSRAPLVLKDPDDTILPVEFLLVTVKNCEFIACYMQLKDPFNRCWFDGVGDVYFGDMCTGQEKKVKVALIRCYKGFTGHGSSLITVKNAVTKLRPKGVISVGTCSGLNPEKTKLGDVVVSAKLTTYASKMVTGTEEELTGMKSYVSRHFLDLIRYAGDGWEAPLKNPAAREVKVHCDGKFLIGPEQVSAGWRREELAKSYPLVTAMEMGGEGIFTAAFDDDIEWLVVKGIADFADGTENVSENWSPFASVMAASVVEKILSDPVVFHQWPHYKEVSAEEPSSSKRTKAEGPSSVPPEIQALGPEAELAFQKAMRHGEVQVHRGRIMFIGQERAGKTSLKKYLLGIPFNPEEESTVGVKVDPSKFHIDVDRIKNWQRTEEEKLDMQEFHEEIAMMIASDLDQNSLLEKNVTVKSAGDIKSSHAVPVPKKLTSDTIQENHMETTKQYDVLSGNMVDTSELLDLDIDTTTDFTNDLMEQVVQCLDHQKLKDDIKAKEYTLNMWDFAGQELYYVSHSVFLSSRAVYILVCNLSKDLHAVAEPSVRQGDTSRCLKNQNRDTNLENLLSWLVSVHRLKPEKNDVVYKDGTPYYVRPPVFIVGTHVDKLPAGKDADEMIECIEGSVTKPNELQQHLIRPLSKVANKGSLGDDDIDKLRDNIQEVLELEPYMGEKIPIRYGVAIINYMTCCIEELCGR
ncbi:hypothetical protein ACROYT_G016350 [Oculina patagonica]